MSPERLLAAAAVVLAYAALCLGIWWRQRRRREAAARQAAGFRRDGDDAAGPVLVAYGSQTGQAEALAWQTAQALHSAGVSTQLLGLNEVGAQLLSRARKALLITSTYGEGDPPDGAAGFAQGVMAGAAPLALGGLQFGLLTLGDSSYRHYCGFGRRLDAWLRAAGAEPMFERVEVDRSDGAALARWRAALSALAGAPAQADWSAPAFAPWRLVERRLLNPGSHGGPCFHLELQPAEGPLPRWEAGDLVELQLAADPQRPREYSIASVPDDGRLHLMVRQERHADGSLGLGSGLLTAQAAPGDTLPLRLRAHGGFRLGPNAGRRLVLIGNGTGLAGLRAHLRARARQRQAAAGGAALPAGDWLVFGERQSTVDAFYRDEIEAWLHDGTLARADLVWSRDQPARRYVQHRLREAGDTLAAWVDAGAAVYVCGSLVGMAAEVDAALADLLGEARLQALRAEGRYRRDVY